MIDAPYRPLPDDVLRRRWLEHLGHRPRADRAFDAVLDAYRRPGRFYHTIEHGLEVAETALNLAVENRPEPDEATGPGLDHTTLVLAAWLHDAHFELGASDNESASADLAAAIARDLGLGPAAADEVHALVLVTTHTAPVRTDAERLLCDADLAVLAKPWVRYLDDVDNIRAELAVADDDAWRSTRLGMLGFFDRRPTLYHLRRCRDRWEDLARVNQGRERRRLTLTG